jgi:uncharacterized protein
MIGHERYPNSLAAQSPCALTLPCLPTVVMSTRPDLCPLCKKPAIASSAPFCSQGCRDRDLLNWLGETYTVPVREDQGEDDSGLDSRGNPSL